MVVADLADDRTVTAPRRHVVAVDIGGTKIAAGVVSDDGALARRVEAPTGPVASSAEAMFDTVCDLVGRVSDDAPSPVIALGVGCPGPGRRRYELVSPLNIPGWRDFPLSQRLAAAVDLPVAVDNDAHALALAEGWLGAAHGVRNYLAMVVSTGIGGAIVLDGELIVGDEGNAGHLGQMLSLDGDNASPVDLEARWSGRAMEERYGRPPAELDDGVRRACGRAIGRVIASVSTLLDLHLAVVSGSVALGFGEPFFSAADEAARSYSLGRRCTVVAGGLGAEGPLLGAAALAFRASADVAGLEEHRRRRPVADVERP